MNEQTAVLQEAQRQLEAIREKLGIKPSLPAPIAPITLDAPASITLPPHLGWDSVAVTAVARQAELQRQKTEFNADWLPPTGQPASLPTPQPASLPTPQPASPHTPNVTVYPDIALGMLRQEQAAAGRIWLLMRHLDTNGQGWLSIGDIRAQLASKGEPLHVCGWRQMRNLLTAGDNIFWQREKERVWLFGVTRTAVSLDVPYLQQRPVAIPATALAKSIGEARAHLYATFHSGRMKDSGMASPIARATLNELSGLSGHTQRKYEQQAGVTAQFNYSIGEKVGETEAEEQSWQNGCASFTFKDKKGKQGKAGSSYVAWQLPNSYAGPHAHQPRGQQKRINRKLADLFMKGMTGNSNNAMITYRPRRFFANVNKAAKEGTANSSYWRSRHNGIWYAK